MRTHMQSNISSGYKIIAVDCMEVAIAENSGGIIILAVTNYEI